MAIDDVRFSAVAAIPEPGSLTLLLRRGDAADRASQARVSRRGLNETFSKPRDCNPRGFLFHRVFALSSHAKRFATANAR